MSNSKIFSDLAELAGGAVGILSSIKQQLRDETRERMDSFANRMDLVTRDDIERLEGMVHKLRTRIDSLEQHLIQPETKTTSSKKDARKKTEPITKSQKNKSIQKPLTKKK